MWECFLDIATETGLCNGSLISCIHYDGLILLHKRSFCDEGERLHFSVDIRIMFRVVTGFAGFIKCWFYVLIQDP